MDRVEIIGSATLYQGDCAEIIKHVSGYDAVITDPPYLMGSASTRQGKGALRPILGEWSNASIWYERWMRLCWEGMAEDGSLWICGNWRSMPSIAMAANAFGAKTSSIVIWDKEWIGVGPLNGLRQRYELIFQFGKGSFAIPNRSEPDIWPVKWASSRPSGHESEKPVPLMKKAINAAKAQFVFDPFMGSGTTGVAAQEAGATFVGCEIEPVYFDMACRRIEQAQRQSDMLSELPKRNL